MSKKLLYCCICCALVSLAQGSALAQTEMVVNGDFELGSVSGEGSPAGWKSMGAGVRLHADTGRFSGSQGLAIDSPAAAYQDFPAAGGETFVVSGRLMQPAGAEALAAGRVATVRLEFRSAEGPIQVVDVAGLSRANAAGAWHSFDRAVTAPTGTAVGRLVLKVTGGASGTTYFEDISALAAPTLIWSDEFDGTSVDSAKWNIINAEDWYDCWYAPHNVEVSGGTLKLHSAEESYNGKNWTGAKLESKYHPQYKYLEARLRHSAPDTKIWATWWTIGWQNNTWRWPPEFDICEFGTQWEANPSQTYHWDVGGGHLYDGDNTGVDETEWHTYGVYWTATDSPIFYVDGLISYAPAGPAEGYLMQALMILTSSPNRDDHYSGCPLAVWEVDYVRVHDVPPTQPVVDDHLALNKPTTVSSEENSATGGDKAVDGIESSRWATEWSDPQWLVVDLGAPYAIDEVKIFWQYASAREYKLQVADSAAGPWTDCAHITNSTSHEAWKTHTFLPQTGRYFRLLCLQRTTEWGYSLYELEVYEHQSANFPFDDDGDGDVDMIDFAVFAGCARSPGSTVPLRPQCDNQDADQDGDVDLADFAVFQGMFGQ